MTDNEAKNLRTLHMVRDLLMIEPLEIRLPILVTLSAEAIILTGQIEKVGNQFVTGLNDTIDKILEAAQRESEE